jgi:hypothetical protein
MKLSLLLILTAFILFAFADPFGYQVNSPIKPVPKEPSVFKEKPLVLTDKPVTLKPEPIKHEEPVREITNEFDECVADCKANNVSNSIIEFCIRENCGRINND